MNFRILIKNPISELKYKKILFLFDIIYIYFTNAVPAVLAVRCSLSVARCPCEKENVKTNIEDNPISAKFFNCLVKLTFLNLNCTFQTFNV
jgi:hypothetical protein